MSDAPPPEGQQFLFHPSEFPSLDDLPAEPAVKTFDRPVWTDNKAHFITRYSRYFVFITKHGTYMDGFAAPQEEKMCDTWAARLVLESEPRSNGNTISRFPHFWMPQTINVEERTVRQCIEGCDTATKGGSQDA